VCFLENPKESGLERKVEAPSNKKYSTFKEFWPFYLQQHSLPETREMHYHGTNKAYAALLTTLSATGMAYLATNNEWSLLGIPASFLFAVYFGYKDAWKAHKHIEKNKPATFTYPFWSLRGDLKMHKLMVIDKLNKKLSNYGLERDIKEYNITPKDT